jgi:hypothetical protein
VTWKSKAKQKYARAVNYFDMEAHGFVITVLCFLFLLLPFRRAICLDAAASCFTGVTNARNGLLEVPLHFLKAKQGYTIKKIEKELNGHSIQ